MSTVCEVKDRGKWYKVDTRGCTTDACIDTPESIISRANSIWRIDKMPDSLGYMLDPVPFMLEELKREFEDARLVSSDWEPGIVY